MIWKKDNYEKGRKIKKNKKIYKASIIISILIIMLCFQYISNWNKNTVNGALIEEETMAEVDRKEDNYKEHVQEVGSLESYLLQKNNVAYSIHYPRFEQEEINEKVNQLMESIIENYMDYSNNTDQTNTDMLYVNYDSFLVGDNIISLVFHVEYSSPLFANSEYNIITKIYNLSTGEELSYSQLFCGEYLEKISFYCDEYFKNNEQYCDLISSDDYKEGIAPSEDNYQRMVITKQGILVHFVKYQLFPGYCGEQFVLVPYDDMEGYLAFDYSSNNIDIKPQKEEMPSNNETKNEPVEIDPNKPMVALSFDDGPYPAVTNRILDVLKKYNSRATFYVVGNRLNHYPDTLRRILSENSEIGSHTYQHKSLSLLNKNSIVNEIVKVDDVLTDIVGQGADTLRPPYGAINDVVKSVSGKPLIYWSIDTEDWRNKNPNQITQHVLDNVKDGDIILLHDLYETSAEAVEMLVPKLIKEGYQIVTVSELFEAKDIALKPGKVYYNAR